MSTKTKTLTHRVIPILTYHIFESSNWKYALDPTLFEEHLSYLNSKGYVSLTLSEYTNRNGLALSTKPFVLTFNGGFKNLEHILPILQKYHCKSTVFVPTAYVGNKSRWLSNQGHTFTLLDWESLYAVNQMGMEIASHGHEHLQLDVIPEVVARHDISYSKALIEDKIGKPCTSFAYPYGYCNTQVKELVWSTGFSVACTMEEQVSSSESDLYSLPRLTMLNGMGVDHLKHFIRQKDSGVLTPYALVKSSVSRQLRRWNKPLRDETIQYREVISPEPLVEILSDEPVVETLADTQSSLIQTPQLNPTQQEVYLETSNPPEGADYPQVQNFLHLTEGVLPSSEHQFEQQGEFLASCMAVLLSYPCDHLDEYKNLSNGVMLLQESQENNLLFDDFEEIQQTHNDFELAVTRQTKDKIQLQKEEIQQLYELSELPTTLLHSSAERIKNILDHHLATLQTHALNDLELSSARGLIVNHKQRLHQSYRQELMRLLQKATKVNALETLKDIQHSMRLLEQDQFPNLEALGQALKDKLTQDKYARANQKKTQKFNQDLESLFLSFENVPMINNENVYSISSAIQYLKEQQPHFSQLSSLLQGELIFSLKNAKKRLQALIKESKTATEVALDILTSNTLDKAFSIFDSPQTDTAIMFAQDSNIGIEFKN